MGTFEVSKKRIVILTDLQYSSLGTDRPNPEKEAFFGVLGGIRYWHLRTDLTFNAGVLPGVTASRSRGWVDGIAGVRGKTHLTHFFGGGGFLVGRRYAR